MNHLDLFSGIGGFALAARWSGIVTIQFVEKDEFCIKVLQKNFPNVPIYHDIKKFNFQKEVDILTGGFPCQPFSVAGKRKGFSDDRYLWPEMLRIIKQCKPRYIIAENVPGIIPMLDPILEDLEKEDYTWQAYLISASSFDAPHKRERLWIIANRNSIGCNSRIDSRQERQLQDDIERHVKTIQSEWTQFKPFSWASFNAQKWLGFTSDSNSEQCSKGATHKDAFAERSEWTRSPSTARENCSIFNWQENEPPIPRVDDGLPNCVDRNKSLGNAIVPQIAYIFMTAIIKL
jgi:DNA (cytosine-5)-methyltransferase 1